MLTSQKSWWVSNISFNFLAISSGLVLKVEDKTNAALVDKSPNFLSFGTSTTTFSNKLLFSKTMLLSFKKIIIVSFIYCK